MPSTGQYELVARGKREWEQMFDAISEPLETQEGYRIRRANLALSHLSNLPIQEIPGRMCHQVVAARDTPCLNCPLIVSQETGKAGAGEVTTDQGLVLEVSVFPLGGEAGSWVVHHRDVTAHRRASSRLRETQHMAAIGRLAAGAAHEINNPLSVITASLNTLDEELGRLQEIQRTLVTALVYANEGKEPKAVSELRRVARAITASGEFLEEGPQLIADSLACARRVAAIVRALRSLALERREAYQPVDARELLASAAKRATAELGDEHLLEWERSVAVPVLAQSEGLSEAFYQIVRNAIQSSTPGKAVTLASAVRAQQAVLTIADRGRGIPANIKDRILEPFFTTLPTGKGLGLGLTTSYGIIQQHGGEMEVRSQEGLGTTVTVSLPLNTPPAPAP
jgi:two-component system NtrC family sensor kinase